MAKRKPRSNLKRNPARRSSYDRILIVCEGEKTEPVYFRALIDKYKINTANVSIMGDCGSDPQSVLTKAKKEQEKANKERNTYDKIFCVFDKDSHPNYQQTITSINDTKPLNKYKSINSVPCFEYWLLLHFEYTTAPFSKTGTKSICDKVLEKLKIHVTEYKKSDKEQVSIFLKNVADAIKNSRKAMEYTKDNKTDNPSTNVYELVEYLQNIKVVKV